MKNSIVEASNANELLIHLKSKKDYIVIKGDYYKEVYNLIRSNLSESEMMGFELGSGGTITILADLINTFRDFIKHDLDVDKTTKSIEKKLRLYKIASVNNNEIVLKLKQLDY